MIIHLHNSHYHRNQPFLIHHKPNPIESFCCSKENVDKILLYRVVDDKQFLIIVYQNEYLILLHIFKLNKSFEYFSSSLFNHLRNYLG